METIEVLADDRMRAVNGDLLGTLELIERGCCQCRTWTYRQR